ncbi:hypothetical protein ACO0LF_26265 [Undibacterium sp. Di27W]|uniref:hypothetical protein n=1 Tax=Undibacterium sp. Di27W TaxID=3413036 RepID=UPI003BF365FC
MNLNIRLKKKLVRASFFTFILVAITWFLFFYGVFYKNLPDLTMRARFAAVAVLNAEYLYPDWDNELFSQSEAVLKMTLEERLSFYRIILTKCEIDGYRNIVFIDVIGGDARDLLENLIQYKKSKLYEFLSSEERKRIDSWIEQLPIVLAQI